MKILYLMCLFALIAISTVLNAMELPPPPGSQAVNTMTTKVQDLAARVKDLRDSVVTIDPDTDIQRLAAAIIEIEDLQSPLQEYKSYIQQKMDEDPEFINRLNDEGMPPRIVEGQLELSLRHDLNAIGMTLGIGTDRGTITPEGTLEGYSKDIHQLVSQEDEIYDMIENLSGPLIRFKNLKSRYPAYLIFFTENRRYTPQEAHVILHIANYVLSVKEALSLAQKDNGRYLLNLLKTYVDWLPWGTHLDEDVEVIKMHGSIMSITDKNNKTMLDWTKELINDVQETINAMKKNQQPTAYMEEALVQLNELATMLKGVVPTDTGQLKKIPTRSLLRTEKNVINPVTGLKPYERPMTEEEKEHIARMKGLGLETERELLEVSDIAATNPELQKNQ
jgi:hypothetical protein